MLQNYNFSSSIRLPTSESKGLILKDKQEQSKEYMRSGQIWINFNVMLKNLKRYQCYCKPNT